MEPQFNITRSETLGKNLVFQRELSEKTIVKTAAYLGIPPEELISFENGETSPSLPQLESLAMFYHVQVNDLLTQVLPITQGYKFNPENIPALIAIRTKLIAALIKKARMEKNLSLEELAEQSNLDIFAMDEFESAKVQIPVPALESICQALAIPLETFFSDMSRLSMKTDPGESVSMTGTINLSPELNEFIADQSNLPYIELAQRLSKMDAAKLRSIAESILEITY